MNRTLYSFTCCIAALLTITACKNEKPASSINGTWKLLSAKTIIKGDTTVTFPVKGQEMIKLFTDTHFAFFRHDTNKGQDSSRFFASGSGTYHLSGNDYTEQLEYCSYRVWENNTFHFTLQRNGDTLIQKGIEKIDSLNVNQEIVETYLLLKNH